MSFLNVDLDIFGCPNTALLLEAFGQEFFLLHRTDEDIHLEINHPGPPSPEFVMDVFLSKIEAFNENAHLLWFQSKERVFSIGLRSPDETQILRLSPALLARVARARAFVEILSYPMREP